MIPLSVQVAIGAAILIELARSLTLWQLRQMIRSELGPVILVVREHREKIRSIEERLNALEGH